MIIFLLGAFILSMVCGLIFTPLIIDFCKQKNLYDIPNERKVHKKAIPRLGGISFFPSMLIAVVIILLFFPTTEKNTLPINIWTIVFLMGLLLIYAIGILDDLVGLKPTTKFFVQIITASLLPFAGLYVNNLYGLMGIYEIPAYVGIPLTVFIIVFIDNAINLIDGIDGLASGLSLLALCGFLVYFIHYEVFMNTYCILVAALMGALVAYSYFNLFGKTENNTKIFMGDSGSLSLGYILGFLAIKCAMDNTLVWPYHHDGLIVPITLLFVPTADVVRVSLHRLIHHQPLFSADKNHIHHKLMRTGLTQHQTLAFILIMALCYILVNSLLYPIVSLTGIVIIDIFLYCMVNVCINSKTKATA